MPLFLPSTTNIGICTGYADQLSVLCSSQTRQTPAYRYADFNERYRPTDGRRSFKRPRQDSMDGPEASRLPKGESTVRQSLILPLARACSGSHEKMATTSRLISIASAGRSTFPRVWTVSDALKDPAGGMQVHCSLPSTHFF